MKTVHSGTTQGAVHGGLFTCPIIVCINTERILKFLPLKHLEHVRSTFEVSADGLREVPTRVTCTATAQFIFGSKCRRRRDIRSAHCTKALCPPRAA